MLPAVQCGSMTLAADEVDEGNALPSGTLIPPLRPGLTAQQAVSSAAAHRAKHREDPLHAVLFGEGGGWH